MGKLDGKASEMVFGVCKQIEGAVMRSKDVANEQKTEALALGLGREKRSEEILRYSRRDAMTIVGDDEPQGVCTGHGLGAVRRLFRVCHRLPCRWTARGECEGGY